MKLSSRYGTNHPKDKAARLMQETVRLTKEQGCTRKELDNASEHNVRKCMREMQDMSSRGENFKRQAEFLGEGTNLDKHRRR